MNEIVQDYNNYAGFWRRFAAAIIDIISFLPLYYLVTQIVSDYGHQAILEVVLTILAYTFLFASPLQATLGTYVMNFHICDKEGGRISLKHSFFWAVTWAFGSALCLAGVIYLQSNFDIMAIGDLWKSCGEEQVSDIDCIKEIEDIIKIPYANFISMVYGALGMWFFMCMIWILSISLSKDKTGFHNILCKTRFVKGRLK